MSLLAAYSHHRSQMKFLLCVLTVMNNRIGLCSVLRLLVTANVVPSSLILCYPDDGGAMFLRTVGSYKRAWHNFQEDGILHNYHCENLKSYMRKILIEGNINTAEISDF
jgi:hypothetical protein